MFRNRLLSLLLISSAAVPAGHAIDEINGPEKLANGTFDEPGQGDGVPFTGWAGRAVQDNPVPVIVVLGTIALLSALIFARDQH